MARAASTLFMISGLAAQMRSSRRLLSIVLICSSSTMERFRIPGSPASDTWVGNRDFVRLVVMAAAMTMGLCLLPVLF